jgi:hypothetical protein
MIMGGCAALINPDNPPSFMSKCTCRTNWERKRRNPNDVAQPTHENISTSGVITARKRNGTDKFSCEILSYLCPRFVDLPGLLHSFSGFGLSAGADMHNYDGMRGEENPCTVLAWKM